DRGFVRVEGQREIVPLTRREVEARGGVGAVNLEAGVRAQVKDDRSVDATDRVAVNVQGLLRSVADTRTESHLHVYAPFDSLGAAQQLPERCELPAFVFLAHDRHQIGQFHDARRRAERRLQNVRSLDVFATALEIADWLDGEKAAALRIEDAGEDRWRVESRPAEPVDRAAPRDQSRGTRAADDGVVGDGAVAHERSIALAGVVRARAGRHDRMRVWNRLWTRGFCSIANGIS